MTIDPQQILPPEMDYAALRAEAYAAVEEMAHEQWTDYNAHDPGITILEAFCYALAEIGYRVNFDIADLLTGPDGELRDDQSFYTARAILTSAAVTDDDYRRLLIDQAGVRNGWLVCDVRTCTPPLYPQCSQSILSYAPRWRAHPRAEADADLPVEVSGIHNLLLQLAPDLRYGDLNSDRVAATVNYQPDAGSPEGFPLELELWFPGWDAVNPVDYQRLLAGSRLIAPRGGRIERLRIVRDSTEELTDVESLHRNVNGLFYVLMSFSVTLANGETATVQLADIGLRLYTGRREDRRQLTIEGVKEAIVRADLLGRYFGRLRTRQETMDGVRARVEEHRKLGEDFCRIGHVHTLEVGVCAELHLDGQADVEVVLAAFYRTVERFLDPPVPFRSLDEMFAAGMPVEEVFTGPQLSRGFIRQADLDGASLRERIAVSDLIDLVMDLPGLAAMEGLRFTTYDATGRVKCSAREWTFGVPAGYFPRLYLGGSSVKVFKDGLPLEPRQLEVDLLLSELRADDHPVARQNDQLDLPLLGGSYPGEYAYLPVQRTLPELYGLGASGLPAGADTRRIAQAAQLGAYLHPLEKIVAATAARVGDFADLFSNDAGRRSGWTDPDITDDAPARLIVEERDLLRVDKASLEALIREERTADKQRGRVLDHLLARFGERVDNYVGLIHDVGTRQRLGQDRLNENKAGLLAGLAEGSRMRSTNAGLRKRLDGLLFAEGDGPLIIEHVRLRPKFPGDAVMEVCLAGDCDHRGQEDPYSFRITYLFDGDEEYNRDISLRAYATRVIRRETPVHLLPKICWAATADREAVADALADWSAVSEGKDWSALNTELIGGTRLRLDVDREEDIRLLLGYFGDVFQRGMQRLLADDPATDRVTEANLETIWAEFLEDLETIRQRDPSLVKRWKIGTGEPRPEWKAWLLSRYRSLATTSLRLHRLLSALRSTGSVYPTATLHDCDDGEDENPVRLGHTSLGTFE